MTACPCCGHEAPALRKHPEPHYACPCCGHLWRPAQGDGEVLDYRSLSGRNRVPAQQLERKFADRLAGVKPLLKDRCRILEVGCAEGGFGKRVKELAQVEYVGLEISQDAGPAQASLDRVLTRPAASLAEGGFDLLLSFHVLEHIADAGAEIRQWTRLLADSGAMLIEVPNAAGHPLRSWDTHPEHLHFFTAASLPAMLERAGLAVESLSKGHFESSIYPDSLRVIARKAISEQEKIEHLLHRFRQVLNGQFVIYGIGGDFRNCLLPILDCLPVAALVDSDPARVGEQVTAEHEIQAYDPARFAGLPVLVASLRFKDEICERLRAAGANPVGLDDIY